MNSIIRRGLLVSTLVVLTIGISSANASEQGAIKMDAKTAIEKINNADHKIINHLDEVEQIDYTTLLDSAMRSPNNKVREILPYFLGHFKADWSTLMLLKLGMDGSPKVRAVAAQEILERAAPEHFKPLIEIIKWHYTLPEKDGENLPVAEWILAAGKAATSKDVDDLLGLAKKEKDPELQEAYQYALGKAGYVKETRRLEFVLKSGTPEQKNAALTEIQFINDKSWILKVVPLLWEDEIAKQLQLGPAIFYFKVCDIALITLLTLDPQRLPDLAEIRDSPFSKPQIEAARKEFEKDRH